MLKPQQAYSMDPAGDVLRAITEHKLHIPGSDIHRELVKGWASVAATKQVMSRSARQLLRTMPERRNTFQIRDTVEKYIVIPPKRDALRGQFGRPLQLVSYHVSKDDGNHPCVVPTCKARFRSLEHREYERAAEEDDGKDARGARR